MMPKRYDHTNKRYGMLTAIEFVGTSEGGHAIWKCRCDCGNIHYVVGRHLKDGRTKSCGCYNPCLKHGKTDTRLYHIWRTMKARCLDKNSHKYSSYGGRCIKICDSWVDDFQAFYDWAMANGYSEDLSIERNDNNGDYCPENCRWATAKEQANNTRRNQTFTYLGKTQTLSQWADELKIPYPTLWKRINKHHWPVEKAFSISTQSEVKR